MLRVYFAGSQYPYRRTAMECCSFLGVQVRSGPLDASEHSAGLDVKDDDRPGPIRTREGPIRERSPVDRASRGALGVRLRARARGLLVGQRS